MKEKAFQSSSLGNRVSELGSHALRRSLSSQVSKVDWQSEKLAPEQWRFLNRLFTQFAELLSPQLTPVLQLRVIVEMERLKQEPFKEFLDELAFPTPMVVFSLDEKNKGIFAVDNGISFAILDCLMGGKGEFFEEAREFTDIEKVLFQKYVLNKFASAYMETWKDVVSFNLKMEPLEFSPNNLILFPYGETVLSVHFAIRLEETEGEFRLMLPLKYLRAIMPRNPDEFPIPKNLSPPPATQLNVSPLVERKLETAHVLVSVELGKAEVPFQDLLNLEVGDILRLDSLCEASLQIQVAGRTKFLGKPGVSENKMAVQITEIVAEGDESFDEQ